MRKSFAFLISSMAAAVLMTGCAKPSGTPVPENVDMQSAKKLKMPIVIYSVGVQKDERGMSRPVVYYVNTSPRPINLATFLLEGKTSEGESIMLWADGYEKVSPDKSCQRGMLGGRWNRADIECVEIKQAGLQINGSYYRFTEENINQLFQDPSINTCE
ncbi:MAG: hypothetical protein P8Y51_05200 [Campylobacterales bacterium]